jgi:hypothetical protein
MSEPKEQLLRALREIDGCLKRAAAGERIQIAAARGKLADLIDWQSDKPATPPMRGEP